MVELRPGTQTSLTGAETGVQAAGRDAYLAADPPTFLTPAAASAHLCLEETFLPVPAPGAPPEHFLGNVPSPKPALPGHWAHR